MRKTPRSVTEKEEKTMTIKEFGLCVEYNIKNNMKHAILGL